MKAALLEILVCPACRAELELRAGSEDAGEVTTGTLRCRGCGAAYPIVAGVPRFVRRAGYASSFGDQWTWFREVQLDSRSGAGESEAALLAATGWRDADYAGRLVLDAGVGAGRFAEVVAAKGAELVGIDLTAAVDAAYRNIGRRDHVHVIQADIFALPFRPGTFDLAYSIGVLHHTPDPRAAFDRVAETVKKGGGFAVYLYAGYGPARRCSDALRRLTTRLPRRLALLLATVAIPLYHVYRLPVVGTVLRVLAPISMHPSWRWRWLDTFDWYTPRYQWKLLYPEVYRWFRANGFLDVEIFDEPIRMRGTKTA